VKKGRHRRYEEARKAKRGIPVPLARCDECGGDAVRGHASWCMAHLLDDEEDSLDQEGGDSPAGTDN
jgi:hypothetical protein